MKTRIVFAISLCAALLSANAHATLTVTDDRGVVVTLARPAQRVVTLSPHATELVFAAGAGERIVATVKHSEYPPAAKALPRVGDNRLVDIERLLAMKPDLLVVWLHNVAERQLEQLRQLNIPLFYSDPSKLEDIPATLERLGVLLGTEREAQRQAQAFRERVGKMAQRYRTGAELRVFYQLWDRPLYTLNRAHIVSDVLRLCGAQNVFAGLSLRAPVVDVEAVLLERPDAIIASAGGKRSSDGLGHWKQYATLPAVQYGNLFSVNADLLNRPGVRILDGAEVVCTHLEQARRQMKQP